MPIVNQLPTKVNIMGSASTTPSSSAFTLLLNLYMKGQISENVWTRMMRLFDADGTTNMERMALARYVKDVVSETGSRSLFIPKVSELNDMLADLRVS